MMYTNKSINFISLIFTIIIFLSLNMYLTNPPKKENISSAIVEIQKKDDIFKNDVKDELPKEQEKEEHNTETEETNLGNWYIEIPKINLKAPIEEGTSSEVLNKKVGHFEETGFTNGNIGLAGHNRGYENNYFENLKKLSVGDKIIYQYNDVIKIYSVDKTEIIKNSDWSYLERTDDNRITLITCVENEPQYRRCIQGVEIEN